MHLDDTQLEIIELPKSDPKAKFVPKKRSKKEPRSPQSDDFDNVAPKRTKLRKRAPVILDLECEMIIPLDANLERRIL